MDAFLILEDGTVFKGKSIGAQKEVVSEVVFNTSMTGYLEVLTDPSYAGQAVVMTYPLIGNYGITDDAESERPWPDAYIVRELSRIPSNFRCEGTIQDYLLKYDIPGICGIDTRALTKLLRDKGTMNGMLTTEPPACVIEGFSDTRAGQAPPLQAKVKTVANVELPDEIKSKLNNYTTGAVVERVSCKEPYVLENKGPGVLNVALMDYGAKRNIARSLHARGCRVTVYPARTPASEIISARPDGIMLSNGPGDPAFCTEIIAEVKKLSESDIPIFAICLGHQFMALANGASTHKMKYGHRGGNHPVRDLATGRVYISSQNHGYVVDTEALDPSVAVPAFENVNDGTNEGLRYVGKNIFTTQFHPEACPGPQDSSYLFDRFIGMMKGEGHA